MAESISTSAVIAVSPSSGAEPVQSGFGPPGDSNEATGSEGLQSQGGESGASPVTLPATGLVWPLGISR